MKFNKLNVLRRYNIYNTARNESEIGNPLRAKQYCEQYIFCMKTLKASNRESFSFSVIVGADVR